MASVVNWGCNLYILLLSGDNQLEYTLQSNDVFELYSYLDGAGNTQISLILKSKLGRLCCSNFKPIYHTDTVVQFHNNPLLLTKYSI